MPSDLTMPDFQTLLYHNANGVLTITMNRPESYNAFNELMKKELNDVKAKLEDSENRKDKLNEKLDYETDLKEKLMIERKNDQ